MYVKERAVLNSIEEEMSIIAWTERRGSKSAEGGSATYVHTCIHTCSVMMEKPTEAAQAESLNVKQGQRCLTFDKTG